MRALVVTAGFLAVAADLHIAPAAAAIAALIEEKPGTGWRFAHAYRAELRGSEEFRRRLGNQPQNELQHPFVVPLPLPAIDMANPHQPAMNQRLYFNVIDLLQIAGRHRSSLS